MVDVAVYRRESLESSFAEIEPLLVRHWAELARNREAIKLDPDYTIYRKMEELGILRVYTARLAQALVGYAVYIVKPHLHYKTVTWAISDILWVDPTARKGMLGIGLLKFAEAQLRLEGVTVMHTTGKEAHPALARVLDHLGHTRIEFGYSKFLGEG